MIANQGRWKSSARKLMDKLPNKGSGLKQLYRKAVFLRRSYEVKVRTLLSYQSIPNPETVYWIDPKRIIYYTNYCNGDEKEFIAKADERIKNQLFRDQVFDRVKDKGRIYGGDWDISDFKFKELEIFKAIASRISRGIAWEDTPFFRNVLNQIEAGKYLWQCENKKDLNRRCQYIDRLISSMRERGYRLNSEVVIEGDDLGSLEKHSAASTEITVNIGRNGEYLFQDSRHRLAIAQILNLDLVPVKVLVRHQEWQELRELLASMTKAKGGTNKRELLSQSPMHPDLDDFPAEHDCQDRWAAIKPHVVQQAGGKAIDVGSNLGYFCHKLEERGYDCYAIELQKEVALAANKIRLGEHKTFKVLSGDPLKLLNSPLFENDRFDIVLALNSLHHFAKTEALYNQLIKWLKTLDVETMFFESHKINDQQMQYAYKNFTEKEFIDCILQYTRLSKSEPVYQARDGKTVHKLTK